VGERSGEYFYQCRAATPTVAAQDDAAAKRLWMASAEIAGIES
jgi:hypothetical protein